MLSSIKKKYPLLNGVLIEPGKLVFEERVKMNCFNCGKYYTNWRCPGNMPQNIDYFKMIQEYKNGAFLYLKMPLNKENYDIVRNESSLMLHKALLDLETYLWYHDKPLAISFIGGSCKLCKNGCGTEKCNNPYNARSPLESIGVNIIKSAAKYGIEINFPPKESLMRLGLLLW